MDSKREPNEREINLKELRVRIEAIKQGANVIPKGFVYCPLEPLIEAINDYAEKRVAELRPEPTADDREQLAETTKLREDLEAAGLDDFASQVTLESVKGLEREMRREIRPTAGDAATAETVFAELKRSGLIRDEMQTSCDAMRGGRRIITAALSAARGDEREKREAAELALIGEQNDHLETTRLLRAATDGDITTEIVGLRARVKALETAAGKAREAIKNYKSAKAAGAPMWAAEHIDKALAALVPEGREEDECPNPRRVAPRPSTSK